MRVWHGAVQLVLDMVQQHGMARHGEHVCVGPRVCITHGIVDSVESRSLRFTVTAVSSAFTTSAQDPPREVVHAIVWLPSLIPARAPVLLLSVRGGILRTDTVPQDAAPCGRRVSPVPGRRTRP